MDSYREVEDNPEAHDSNANSLRKSERSSIEISPQPEIREASPQEISTIIGLTDSIWIFVMELNGYKPLVIFSNSDSMDLKPSSFRVIIWAAPFSWNPFWMKTSIKLMQTFEFCLMFFISFHHLPPMRTVETYWKIPKLSKIIKSTIFALIWPVLIPPIQKKPQNN